MRFPGRSHFVPEQAASISLAVIFCRLFVEIFWLTPSPIFAIRSYILTSMHFVDGMDSCEEMMIQDWPGALYKKDDTAFLCWTYSPEVTYVLEYTPSKIDDSEIIKMAESAEPVK